MGLPHCGSGVETASKCSWEPVTAAFRRFTAALMNVNGHLDLAKQPPLHRADKPSPNRQQTPQTRRSRPRRRRPRLCSLGLRKAARAQLLLFALPLFTLLRFFTLFKLLNAFFDPAGNQARLLFGLSWHLMSTRERASGFARSVGRLIGLSGFRHDECSCVWFGHMIAVAAAADHGPSHAE